CCRRARLPSFPTSNTPALPTPENIEAGLFQQPAEAGVCGCGHPLTQAAAELDFASGFVAKDVLHQKRYAAEWAIAERRFIKGLNPIRIGFNHSVDGRVDRINRPGCSFRKLMWRYFTFCDQLGDAECVIS